MPRIRQEEEGVTAAAPPPPEPEAPPTPPPPPAVAPVAEGVEPPAEAPPPVYRVAEGKSLFVAGEMRHAGSEVRAFDVGGDEALAAHLAAGVLTKS